MSRLVKVANLKTRFSVLGRWISKFSRSGHCEFRIDLKDEETRVTETAPTPKEGVDEASTGAIHDQFDEVSKQVLDSNRFDKPCLALRAIYVQILLSLRYRMLFSCSIARL